MAISEGDLIERYIALRDKKKAMEAEHKAAIRPYDQALEGIENYFLGILNERQTDSTKAGAGIAYKTRHMNPKLTDRQQLIDYVKFSGNFDIFTNSLSKEAIKAFIDEKKVSPPGVEVEYFTKVNIRRA